MKGGNFMKAKKVLSLVMAVCMLFGVTAVTASAKDIDYPIGYFNIAYPNRTLIFACDGGSYIRPIEKPYGTSLNIDNYVPVKEGYIFDGWYADPRTKIERVTNVTLTENIVVYAKWIDDGSVKQNENVVINRTVTDSSVILETTSGTVEAPVTQLWIQQNARLEALMKLKYEHFNK